MIPPVAISTHRYLAKALREKPASPVYTYTDIGTPEKARSRSMEPIFSFLFETRAGLAVLFFGGIVIVAIAAFVLEKRTHKIYVDRGPASDDEDGWTL